MAHDAHARPPDRMRVIFKRWQKSTITDIDQSDDLWDFSRLSGDVLSQVTESKAHSSDQTTQEFDTFLGGYLRGSVSTSPSEPICYEAKALPGLFVYPALLPADVQVALLDKLLHRDLSSHSHQTNLHLHYHIPYKTHDPPSLPTCYASSFFLADQHETLSPKDPTVHRSITIKQMLERKLRWITLGGQYDWSAKLYPPEKPPQFPEDISRLLTGLFPDVDAQAAIVNLYSPGDTLSVHRDVSEECDRGLVSISIGCDGIFIIGTENSGTAVSMRLRSGDVVVMSGEARYAWHAVPKVLSDTCPDWLHSWPDSTLDTSLSVWKGWMRQKRINVNIRQMKD